MKNMAAITRTTRNPKQLKPIVARSINSCMAAECRRGVSGIEWWIAIRVSPRLAVKKFPHLRVGE